MSGEWSILQEGFSRLDPVAIVEEAGSGRSDSYLFSNDESESFMSNKRMHAQTSAPSKPKRGQANKRERVRTENVNAGFDRLRKLIPTDPVDRKLSKIEILRLATSYISHLYNLTRANSCLEAEEMYREVTSDEEDIEDDSRVEKVASGTGGTHKTHVCTFCLMMNKGLTRKR